MFSSSDKPDDKGAPDPAPAAHPAARSAESVAAQLTDALTQANVTALGVGPAVAIVQSCLAAAQAHSVLWANMAHEHQELGMAAVATTVRSVMHILEGGKGGG